MKNDFLQNYRKKAYFLLYLQIIIILLIAVFYLFTKGKNDFFSAIAGGVCWLLPTFYFARKLFIMPKSKTAISVVKNFFFWEVIKLMLSGFLIVISLKFLHVEVLSFLIAYMAAVLSIGAYPIILFLKSND